MKIKVCHLTSVHDIEDIRIFHKECVSLAKNGFNVAIIACDETAYDKVKNGVRLISLKVPVRSRLERMTKRTRAIYKKALEVDADIYHLHDPELIPHGSMLKRKGKAVIFDSHENISMQILSKNYIPKIIRNLISFLYSKYETKKLKKFDCLIAVNEDIANRFASFHSCVHVVTNYPLLNEDYKVKAKTDIQNNELIICFAGNIKHDYLHHNIIKAIQKIGNVKYILAGSGDQYYLEQLKNMEGWKHVEFLGRIPYEKVAEIYSHSSVGIALHDYTPNVGFRKGGLGFVKNFEFMMAGLPIICSKFEVWDAIISEYKCGITVEPHCMEELINAITFFKDNPEKAFEMGRNGRRAVEEEYNWSTQEKELLRLYNSL